MSEHKVGLANALLHDGEIALWDFPRDFTR